MTSEQVDRLLSIADRYVLVQESMLAINLARVQALAESEKRVADIDERNARIREREATAAEIQATRTIEFSGSVTGDVTQRSAPPNSAAPKEGT